MTTPELPPLRWIDGAFVACATASSIEARERILIARIAELEREAEYWKMDGVHSCHAECPRIACVQRRRIAELEADAERYRWLRDTPDPEDFQNVTRRTMRSRWDAAIDAAREGK